MSMPAKAPIAKAASVQAANEIPRRSNRPEANGDAWSVTSLEMDRAWLPAGKYGW